jgi:GAF domain-containing protein
VDSTNEHPNIGRDDLFEVIRHVSEIVGALFLPVSVTDTLQLVVNLATATVEGCDYAGLFLVEGGVVSTLVHTDPVVVEIDALQHLTGEGPCLDAIAHRLVFYVDDLKSDLRWPHFAPQATSAGIRSMLALPLADEARFGALNLYSRFPAAFGVIDRAKAAILASMISQALTLAQTYEDEERRSVAIRTADLRSRQIIGQAQGILMEREQISADAAFDILHRASQHLHIKFGEVAQNLIDTGERPNTGPALEDQQ